MTTRQWAERAYKEVYEHGNLFDTNDADRCIADVARLFEQCAAEVRKECAVEVRKIATGAKNLHKDGVGMAVKIMRSLPLYCPETSAEKIETASATWLGESYRLDCDGKDSAVADLVAKELDRIATAIRELNT